MIRTGILSDHHPGSEPVWPAALFKELKVTSASSDREDPASPHGCSAKDIILSSDMIYVDLPALSAEEVKLAFRHGTHIFFRRIPSLTIEETNELINIENEAGCMTQIFLPHLFLPENLALFRHLQGPLLVNIRLKADPGAKLGLQLRSVLLILTLLDKSSLKKTDVNTLEGGNGSYIMDIRMAYSSGSVVRIILSTHFQEDQSVFELFQVSKPVIPVPVIPLSPSKQLLSEQYALSEFIKAIQHQPAILISLNEFLLAQQMMQKISEKLRLRGSILMDY